MKKCKECGHNGVGLHLCRGGNLIKKILSTNELSEVTEQKWIPNKKELPPEQYEFYKKLVELFNREVNK